MSQAETPNTDDGLTFLDAFDAFYREYYKPEIHELADKYPSEQSSLTIEYEDLWGYDPAIADDWRTAPGEMRGYAEEALGQFDIPVDIDLSGASVRLTDTEEFIDRQSVAGLSEQDLGRFVAIRGQLNRVTDTIPLLEEGVFVCKRCAATTTVPQTRTSGQEPHECVGCERQGPFSLDVAQSEWTDIRKLKLEEPPEEQVDARGETMPAIVDGDLVHAGGENGLPDRSGERVTVLGELTLNSDDLFDGGDGPEGEPYLNVSSIVFDERDDAETIDLDAYEDDIDELRAMAGDGLIEAYRDSIAPTIMADGDDDLQAALEALVAYLFNGYRLDPEGKSSKRGDLHIGIIGDPGKGKTQILSRVAELSPKSEFRSGTGVTKVGLTAAAVQEEFFGNSEWTLRPGILPRGNGGHTIIDEIDAAVDEKTKAIHDALEGDQMVKVDKAGIRANLPTRTAVCVSGNPTDGRFDRFQSLADQVDMDPALISRMDGLFALTDVPDPEHDRDVAEHILDSFDELSQFELAERNPETDAPEAAETIDPPIPTDVFQAAIVHAQEAVFPTLTDEAKGMLREFYVDVRDENEEKDDPVPATARTLEAGIRFSMAFARAEFSETVEHRHAKRAIDLSKRVVGLNYDPQSGKFDAGMVDEGTPQSQKERRRKLLETIEERQDQGETDAVGMDTLAEIAEEQLGVDKSQVEHDVDQLLQNGELVRPRSGEVRTV